MFLVNKSHQTGYEFDCDIRSDSKQSEFLMWWDRINLLGPLEKYIWINTYHIWNTGSGVIIFQVIVRGYGFFFGGSCGIFWDGNVFIQHITSTKIFRFDQTDILFRNRSKHSLEFEGIYAFADRKISFCERSSKTLVRTSGRTQFRLFWTKCLENLIGLVNVYHQGGTTRKYFLK